ncbi:MAG: hypothetical protein KDD22_02680 [Bdellovibrionales bacterium]|nr:hypothetical protein [Bdellovibrionales bacterium]
MKSAFARLLLIAMGTVSLLFIALIVLRFLGLQTATRSPQHPLLDKSFWIFVQPDYHQMSLNYLESWKTKEFNSPEAIPWIDFRRTQEGQWWVAHEDWIEIDGKPRPFAILKAEELKQIWKEKAVSLKEVLTLFHGGDLFLNVSEKDPFWVKSLIENFDKDWDSHILAHSPVYQFGHSLRQSKPEWLFASDAATVSRWLFLSGLWLEPIADFWPDVFFAPPILQGREVFSKGMRQELTRRGVAVVVDLTNSKTAPILFEGLKLKGLATKDLESALEFQHQLKSQ